jgi:hypothetical protein
LKFSFRDILNIFSVLYPNVAKVGGLQSQGVKGEAVASLLRSLDNAESEVLRLSRRVNNKVKSTPSLEYTNGDIHELQR